MNSKKYTYLLKGIPDPSDSRYRELAGGDVTHAVWHGSQSLLNAVSRMPAESGSAAIRYAFNPEGTQGNPQGRLSLCVCAAAITEAAQTVVPVILNGGPIGRFFPTEAVDGVSFPYERITAVTHIKRRERLTLPLVALDANRYVPRVYYACDSFKANSRANQIELDTVLHRINVPVLIDICVEPEDVSPEATASARYLDQLKRSDQTWLHEERHAVASDVFAEDTRSRSPRGCPTLHERDPAAGSVLRDRQRFHESLKEPHLHFHIMVLSADEATSRLVATIFADTAFQDGTYQLVTQSRKEAVRAALDHLQHVRVFDGSDGTGPFGIAREAGYAPFSRLPYLATVAELAGAFRLPVASDGSPLCIRMSTDLSVPTASADAIVFGYDHATSTAGMASESRLPLGVKIADLAKGVLVTGVPGSAKTNFVFVLMLALHKLGIPFRVIEGAKTEYRAIKRLRDHPRGDVRSLAWALEICTPSAEFIVPYRTSILEPPRGVSRDAHISMLRAAFSAGMALEWPLQPILSEALRYLYEWHDKTGIPLSLSSLDASAQHVVRLMGYAQEANSNISGALRARLQELQQGALGKILQCESSIPDMAHRLTTPTIVEMDHSGSDDKSLITYLDLGQTIQALKSSPNPGQGLRYVYFIEEAHGLVGRGGAATASSDNPDPKAYASEALSQAIAEIRALGAGVIVVDQTPSKLPPDVIQNLATKMAFRLVHAGERDIIADSTLMTGIAREDLARLTPGTAYIFSEGYHRARKIRVENLHAQMDLSEMTSEELTQIISQEEWYRDAARKRVEAEVAVFTSSADQLDKTRLEIAGKFRAASREARTVLDRSDGPSLHQDIVPLTTAIRKFRRELADAMRKFARGPWRRFRQGTAEQPDVDGSQAFRETVAERYTNTLKPDGDELLRRMDSLAMDLDKTGRHRR